MDRSNIPQVSAKVPQHIQSIWESNPGFRIMRVTSMTCVTASAISGPNLRANSGQLGSRSAPYGGTAVLHTVALNALTCATCSSASLHRHCHILGAGLDASASMDLSQMYCSRLHMHSDAATRMRASAPRAGSRLLQYRAGDGPRQGAERA